MRRIFSDILCIFAILFIPNKLFECMNMDKSIRQIIKEMIGCNERT